MKSSNRMKGDAVREVILISTTIDVNGQYIRMQRLKTLAAARIDGKVVTRKFDKIR